MLLKEVASLIPAWLWAVIQIYGTLCAVIFCLGMVFLLIDHAFNFLPKIGERSAPRESNHPIQYPKEDRYL